MFSNTEDTGHKNRTRAIMLAAGLLVVAVAAVIIVYSARQAPEPGAAPAQSQGLPNAKRAGDPEFEKYKGLVSLVNKKFFTQANLLGQRQALAKGDIANFTDRVILGVELRGKVIGKDGSVLATVLASPVPKVYEKILPGGSVPYSVTIDGVPQKAELDDITLELEGIVFAE